VGKVHKLDLSKLVRTLKEVGEEEEEEENVFHPVLLVKHTAHI
jgi:hypothetical protein